jgi:hypothetical protein
MSRIPILTVALIMFRDIIKTDRNSGVCHEIHLTFKACPGLYFDLMCYIFEGCGFEVSLP